MVVVAVVEIFYHLFTYLRQADQYNLRNRSQLIIPNVKTVNHGFESLRYLGPKIWETIPSHLKEIDILKYLPSKDGNQNRVHIDSAKYVENILCIFSNSL